MQLSHDKVTKAFDDATLEVLVKEMGFGSYGDPEQAARFVYSILSKLPLYENWRDVDKELGSDFYLVLYWLDHQRLIEHGGSVGGSWLDEDKGRKVLSVLETIDWELPANLSPAILSFDQAIQPLQYQCDEGETEWQKAEQDEYQLTHECGFCGCGDPGQAQMRLLQMLNLTPLSEHQAEFAALIANPGMRQFYKYQLCHLGMIDTTTGALTEHGAHIVRLLEEAGGDNDFENS